MLRNKRGTLMAGSMEMIQVAILIGLSVVVGLIFKTEITAFVNTTFAELNG